MVQETPIVEGSTIAKGSPIAQVAPTGPPSSCQVVLKGESGDPTDIRGPGYHCIEVP